MRKYTQLDLMVAQGLLTRRQETYSQSKKGTVDRVIFNDPATIVYWKDGTRTLVKCSADDVFDKEQGFFMACFLKATGMTKTKAAKFLTDMRQGEKDEKTA